MSRETMRTNSLFRAAKTFPKKQTGSQRMVS